jgi:signal transduction histidine kinase
MNGSVAQRYGVALASLVVAVLVANLIKGAPVSIFLLAAVIAVRFGGLGPGILVVALSEVVFAFGLEVIDPSIQEVPQSVRQALFGLTAVLILYISAKQRDATTSHARARDELDNSLQHVRALWRQTFRAHDEERQRIARMMHETLAQDLAVLKMQLARLQRTTQARGDEDRELIAESIELAEQSIEALRTQSYLLYPPFLDEAGLLEPVRWYATGFARRSNIAVTLELPDCLERMPHDVELTLFRVVQEALINIHRHANSPTATIRLRRDAHEVVLEVEDHGRGMPAHVVESMRSPSSSLVGVGLPGLRERLQQLDGGLEIESTEGRLTLRAAVPLAGSS